MKIFISVSNIVDIGGISTAIINLLNEISSDNEVTICAINNYISPNKRIPENVRVLPGSDFLEDCFCDRAKMVNQNFFRKILRTFRRSARKINGRAWAIERGINGIDIDEKYDVAIAFSNDSYDAVGNIKNGGNYPFVLSKINAARKIAWIHNDARECGFTKDNCEKIFDGFDAIVNVSYNCKQILDELSPKTISKSKVVYNMYDLKRIIQQAGNVSPYQENGKIHFVTVCRLKNQQKRVDRIIYTVKRLVDEGYVGFDWTIVGDGDDRANIEAMIRENNISEYVVMTGLKPNPYPYMKFADAFVLPSLYEGYGMTIKESQIVGTPTLVTNFGPAHESVKEGENGLICDNSAEGLYGMIKSVLEDPSILVNLKRELMIHPVDNTVALKQFYDVCTGDDAS